MAQKIYLSFLWHQHQPYYKDLKTGQAIMPWVRLHATKDYYDMAAILDDFPKIRMTINLVPSLVAQLLDFADNACPDPWLEKTLIPAKDLSSKDRVWILENFFYCNWDNMIFPHPRFAELFERRGRFPNRERLERSIGYFSDQDFLDLQCWFNLAWMDPLWRQKDPTIAHLFKKGKGFAEGEKALLIEKQREICRLTIEKHKELWHKGQIEVSTTPFYHPILPLLCDTDAAEMSMPGSLKPKKRFQHPEDALHQVKSALDYMESVFGKRPAGMWPSEGSVSEEAASILTGAGVRWAATDEGVLYQSLARDGKPQTRETLYQPFRIDQPGGGLQIIFRDHALSDSIGFVYARMDPGKAVDDFVGRILKIAEAIPDNGRPPLVSIILDGENCWENYYNDGHDFLSKLYGTLSDHPRIETTTISDYLKDHPPAASLKKLWAGSWINSDFRIWIGHPEDNRAWDLVSETREFLTGAMAKHPEKAEQADTKKAWESFYIAEGSDWCWWYGDQNSTAQDAVFDELFRNHLKNVYTFMGQEPPHKLSIAIKGKEQRGRQALPLALITPKIDGLVTSYYEWRSGGFYEADTSGGAMHQAESFLASFHYAFDLENLYIRMDTKSLLKEVHLEDLKIKISFIEPAENELQISWEPPTGAPEGESALFPKAIFLDSDGKTTLLTEIAARKIIELAIPFSLLKVQKNDPLEFIILVIKQGIQIERWPSQTAVQMRRPSEDFGSEIWSA